MLLLDSSAAVSASLEKTLVKCFAANDDLRLLQALPNSDVQYLAFALQEEGPKAYGFDVFQWALFLYEKLVEVHAEGEDGLEAMAAGFSATADHDDTVFEQDDAEQNDPGDTGEDDLHADGSTSSKAKELWLDAFELAIERLAAPANKAASKTSSLFFEKAKCPFETSGVRVLALLTEDGQYHPAVTVREVHDVFKDNGGDHKIDIDNNDTTEGVGEGVTASSGAAGQEEVQLHDGDIGIGGVSADGTDAAGSRPGSGIAGESANNLQKANSKATNIKTKKKMKEAKVRPRRGGGGKLHPAEATRFFEVRFTEFGKVQLVKEENLIFDDHEQDRDDGEKEVGEGECEVCGLFYSRITFHHLIPKSTHRRWLRRKRWPPVFYAASKATRAGSSLLEKHLCRGLWSGAWADKTDQKLQCTETATSSTSTSSSRNNVLVPPPTRILLNCYGAMLCGKCHAQVHKLASNDVLAVDFNSVDAILADPRIKAWLTWRAK
eukprot:g9823.t1